MSSSHACAQALKDKILPYMIFLSFAELGLCFHLATMQNLSVLSLQGLVLCHFDVLTK